MFVTQVNCINHICVELKDKKNGVQQKQQRNMLLYSNLYCFIYAFSCFVIQCCMLTFSVYSRGDVHELEACHLQFTEWLKFFQNFTESM